jgi:hypothetical protein
VPFYVWWAIPLVATIVAVVVVSWRSRDRDVDPHSSVAQRRAFERAMRKGVPGTPAQSPPGGTGSTGSGLDDGGAGAAADAAGPGPSR